MEGILMPFGIDPARLFNVAVIALAVICAGAFLWQVKQAGANEQAIKDLKLANESLAKSLNDEKKLRLLAEGSVKERDKEVENINKEHSKKINRLNSVILNLKESDKCLDKTIPQQLQIEVFGS
jgi:hypothetical protein